MLKKKRLIPPLVTAMAFFVAAVVMLSGPTAFSQGQEGGPVTATGVLERAAPHSPDPTPIYAITDKEAGTSYELKSSFGNLEQYVGKKVTIQGVPVPGPGGPSRPPLLNVTQIQLADNPPPPPPPPPKAAPPPSKEAEAKEGAKEKDKQKADQQKEAAKPEEESSPLERVAEKLRGLVRSSIAFNTPEEMEVGKTETIELLLSTSSSAEELKQQLSEAGEKQGVEEIPTAERMQARLTGDPGFVIQATTPEEQAISSEETTKWNWDVTPTQAGEEQKLHLTLTALIEVAGETTPRAIDTYNRTILVKDVQKSWGQRVSEFIGNNWQWLWATILVPIALWAYRTYRGRKEAKQKSDAA